MSAPPGFAASNSTSESSVASAESSVFHRPRSAYLERLALAREAASLRRQSAYGLVMGWVLVLVAGFLYFCVPSRVDWFWAFLMSLGGLHLAAAVVLPQALAWPERVWLTLARWQGWLVMTVLLTIVYFFLIWPASLVSRRRTEDFITWTDRPPERTTAWEKIDPAEADVASVHSQRYRTLPLLLAGVIAFFFRRGNYILLPIIILLIVLGLVLYFVQSSALAPFIYTLF